MAGSPSSAKCAMRGERMREIGSWDRNFQVWQYSVSHSTLLLRSFHPHDYCSRIDVFFPAVTLMHLRPNFHRLSIHEANEKERRGLLGNMVIDTTCGSLFLLNGGEGYVHAASCSWHEDEGDHRAPSRFGPLRGTD